MKAISLLLAAASGAMLAACGSHSQAPVVYGTNPGTTGRIYNSPADYDRMNPGVWQANNRTASRAPSKITAAPVTPVSASITENELPPAPTYVSASAPAPARAHAAKSAQTVRVRQGDTVYAIARRTGASPSAIISENNLRAPYALAIGDTLRIPDPAEKIANRITEPSSEPVRIVSSGRAYTVRNGDTLYSISRQTGVSVDALAQANRLSPPYDLEVGTQLSVPSGGQVSSPVQREANAQDVGELARTVSYSQPVREPEKMFDWPVKGAIIGGFGAGSNGRRNDGVNIAAPVGTAVRASADGEVVYRGSELDGYGNLLLIKHDDGFVTAYAHNDVMLARKGQKVRQGEVIAKVGQTGAATEPQLHFEIRQNLKSVDPMAFLDE